MDSVLPNVTLECSLGNTPDPPPHFSFTVERILVSNDADSEMLQMQMSNDNILQLNETALLSLFDLDTKTITVTCEVSNTFGVAGISTTITICGTYGLWDPSMSVTRLASLVPRLLGGGKNGSLFLPSP